MYSKKNFLDFAFEEAITSVNISSIPEEAIMDTLITGMHAYADRVGQTFTEEEMKATIIAGLETLKKAGTDFSFQNWTMPR